MFQYRIYTESIAILISDIPNVVSANGFEFTEYIHLVFNEAFRLDDTKRIATVNHWEQDTLGRENDLPVTKGGPSVTKIRYSYGNHLGSASLELDDIGGFVSYQEYFPFGGTSYTVGKVSSEYRFTGKELDEFTGLYYFGARYYASWLGRWTTADPKRENEDGINLYQYCRNSPVGLTDPDGMTSDKKEPSINANYKPGDDHGTVTYNGDATLEEAQEWIRAMESQITGVDNSNVEWTIKRGETEPEPLTVNRGNLVRSDIPGEWVYWEPEDIDFPEIEQSGSNTTSDDSNSNSTSGKKIKNG